MAERIMMDGSSSTKSYLVLGQREGMLKVGIRPLFALGYYGLDLCMRVRVNAEDGKQDELNVGELAAEMMPRTKFQNSNSSRVSSMVGIRVASLDHSLYTKESAQAVLNSAVRDKIILPIYHLPGFEFSVSIDEVMEYLHEQLDILFKLKEAQEQEQHSECASCGDCGDCGSQE